MSVPHAVDMVACPLLCPGVVTGGGPRIPPALVEITAPAALQSPLHLHYTEDEDFYVLEGDVTMVVGDTPSS